MLSAATDWTWVPLRRVDDAADDVDGDDEVPGGNDERVGSAVCWRSS